MEQQLGEFYISDDKQLLQPERVYKMLSKSYWAADRDHETIKKSIEHSFCFGIYRAGEQIGFARCVTDYATIFWLADVIVDERFRSLGLGKALIETILSDERLQGLSGLLATRDAHGLYARHGFALVDSKFYMKKPAVLSVKGASEEPSNASTLQA